MNSITTNNSTKSQNNSTTEFFSPASRRGMLAGLGAALAAVPMAASASQASGPDGRLIELCAEHAALSRRYNAMFAEHGHDDAGRAVAQRPLRTRQVEIEAVVWRMRSTTIEGFKARARMILAWSPDILEGGSHDIPDPAQTLALLRDLTA